MFRRFVAAMLLACGAAFAGAAHGAFFFHATLTQDQETPPPPTPQGSGGFASFVLNDAMTRLTYDVRLFGLDLRGVSPAGVSTPANIALPGEPVGSAARLDNITRMHIHAAPFGVPGGIVFGMLDLPTNGQFLDDPNDLAIDVANLHVTGAWDLNEGVGNQPALAAQLANLFAGNLYLNVHTEDFPGGEIRGQILLAEPSSLALLALGAFGLGLPASRRRRALR